MDTRSHYTKHMEYRNDQPTKINGPHQATQGPKPFTLNKWPKQRALFTKFLDMITKPDSY